MIKMIVVLVLMVLFTANISADKQTIEVQPWESLELPTIISDKGTEQSGLIRTMVQCIYTINDIKGAEQLLEGNNRCPRTPILWEFEDDVLYSVQTIAYTIKLIEAPDNWELINKESTGNLTVNYVVTGYDEPESSFLQSLINDAFDTFFNWMCGVFNVFCV